METVAVSLATAALHQIIVHLETARREVVLAAKHIRQTGLVEARINILIVQALEHAAQHTDSESVVSRCASSPL